jgi:putative ABC transport system ATP-binding protein
VSTVIEARGLVRRYPGEGSPVRAVDGVDLVVEAGEAVSVMGPSGCGKSTLLHLLGGLERPDAGELYLGGERVDGLSETRWAVFRRRAVGFVFQAFHLVDELTAVENVELPALLVGVARRAARHRAMELLERLGVAGRAGQTLLVVTHDARVASTADRLLTMRDGAIVAQTRLDAGTSVAGLLASLADLGGER